MRGAELWGLGCARDGGSTGDGGSIIGTKHRGLGGVVVSGGCVWAARSRIRFTRCAWLRHFGVMVLMA
jgi:hypothetical protein